jgi:hypothetical protein
MKATIDKGATIKNGGYDLFFQELKKYIVTKGNKLMLWEDWYNKSHPSISKTEDADFEVVEPLKIENKQPSPPYIMKRKLMKERYNIEIREI